MTSRAKAVYHATPSGDWGLPRGETATPPVARMRRKVRVTTAPPCVVWRTSKGPDLPLTRFGSILCFVSVNSAERRRAGRVPWASWEPMALPESTGSGGHRLRPSSMVGWRKPPASRLPNGRPTKEPRRPRYRPQERALAVRHVPGMRVEPREPDLSPRARGLFYVSGSSKEARTMCWITIRRTITASPA